MLQTGKLTFFCGKMGAGKSTQAKQLATKNNAILLSEDDWLTAHFPNQINTFEHYLKYSNLIKPFVKNLVQDLLLKGVEVVMDFPANTKKQRQWLVQISSEIECEHQLVFLDITNEQCLKQIAKRRKEHPERAQFDTEAVFHQVTQYFEPPQDSENLNTRSLSKSESYKE